MKKTIKFLGFFMILFGASFALNTNISAQEKKEILIVADKTANCAGNSSGCLQIKRITEEKFTPMNEGIENFQFVPGYFYLLEVGVSPAGSSSNGSKAKYQLEKILARVKSGDSSSSTMTVSAPGFSGTEWKLTHVEGNAVKADRAFIKFQVERDSVSGNGGCNTFNGSLTKSGNQIKMPEIFANKQFCADASIVEIKFLSNLDRVTRYEISGAKLKLFAADSVILEFEAKK